MSHWFTRLRLTLRSVFRRERVEQELDEELQYHLARQIDEGLRTGLGPQEARHAALRAMGAIAKSKEECRDMRRVNFIDDFFRDIRYSGRSLRRSPGFAALAVLIMALGVGANTAVFSVVNAVLLKPLSFRDPDRIVTMYGFSTIGAAPGALSKQPISTLDFQDWHDQSSSFEAMAYYASRETSALAGVTAEYAQAAVVSPEFFRVLAVEPVFGRVFSPEEVKRGSGGAVMISYAYWQSHFGGDSRVMGQTVRMYGRALPICGVLPPGFSFPGKTDLWFPNNRPPEPRAAHNYLAIGRLKPGVAVERAQAEMASIAQRLEQQYPQSNKSESVAVVRMRDEMVRDVRLTLYLLLGAVSIVLLMACANTATLLLGKAMARTHEVALRLALGASRRRIMRQFIAESVLVACLAGALGLLFAYGGSKGLVALAPSTLPRLAETGIDAWVLAFTFGISIATSLVFGLAPSLYASKVDLNDALKQAGSRSLVGGGLARMKGILVVAEIALAVVLVCGAGLLIKSFVALHNVALGFRPANVLVMRATVPGRFTPEDVRRANQFFKDILAQTAILPGVLAVGATMSPPGHVDARGSYFVDHMPERPDYSGPPGTVLSIVAPGTFAALGIALKGGRDFRDRDTYDAPFTAIVNEALVRKSFRYENPVGRTIFCPFDSSKGMTIIGVVGDVRQDGPAREPTPECYMPYQQHQYNGATLSIVARTVGDPTALEETLRRMTQERSPDVPMKFTTMEAALSENVAAPRFRTLLFGLFAGLAVCLAMAGVYGVIAYAVGQRSSEIGLRMALGASTGSVLRLVLGQGVVLGGLGLALGLAAAIAGTRLLTTMLFHVQPNDPWVYLAVVALLGIVTLVAGYVPARRAAKIDPVAALRQE